MSKKKVCIIAEAGVNHNGDYNLACRLIAAAAKTGADIVKFQTFRSDALVTADAAKAAYQAKQTGGEETQHEMLKRLELSYETFHRLLNVANDEGIGFLSTPFDIVSLTFLVEELGLKQIKLGSGELTNGPILLEAARLDCDLIVSTGMSSLADVSDAVGVLAFGYANPSAYPSGSDVKMILENSAAMDHVRRRVTLLHCTSQYPAPVHDSNLAAMDTLKQAFGTAVGFSDHTDGIVVSLAAVARGAIMIEKHLTLDQNMPGPDHKASLEPGEFARLVRGIREIEDSIGDGRKDIQSSEVDTRDVARKSLVALVSVKRGEVFTAENLGVLRPGTGISPIHYWDWLGRSADRDYIAGEMIGR
ncbi:MAG: N-acetylneuraminate synthase [Rhizobiales bacterium]|nr:N-acetylneuraminate synthase [Hyphomicrobiales bacterium]OJY43011.1 MAG: N-acetylneuraminate synthase [Rhizobiales bacterium 64-17]